MRLLFAALMATSVLFVSSRARADNDGEVRTLIDAVFQNEYAKKDYIGALNALQLASDVCQEGQCGPQVRGKVLVAVATVLAGGLEQKEDAAEVFRAAIKEDPKVTLIKGYDQGPIREAWNVARGVKPTPPPTGERKKYDGTGKPPKGWKSAEAFFYFEEARASEEAEKYDDCIAYADDSFTAEARTATKFLKASCLERSKRWVDALAIFREVETEANAAKLRDTARVAAERTKNLETNLPRMIFVPPGDITDLKVELDGRPIAAERIGEAIAVDPGKRRISATAKRGEESLSYVESVEVAEGASERINLRLVPSGSPLANSTTMQCLSRAKTKEEIRKCVGDASEGPAILVRIGSEISGYHDTDHVDVVTPALTASVESAPDGWGINAAFLVDVVTAASTDIVATASPRWTEVRYVPAIGGYKKLGDVTVGISGNMSIEPDYTATSVGASVAADLAEKMVTPSLNYSFGYDISGRAGTSFETYSETIIHNAIDLGVSIVLDKSTVLAIGSTLVFENGDSSKPYRYVPMFRPTEAAQIENLPGLTVDAVNSTRLPERVHEQLPTDRQRFALAGRIAHRFDDATLRVEERLYVDSWGLKSSTTDGTFPFDVGERFRVWPHLRGHFQTGTDFWRIAYVATPGQNTITVPQYRTGDRELGPLISVTGGGGVRFAAGEDKNWGVSFAGDLIYTRYLKHLFILERFGFFGALGLEVDIE